MKYNEFIAAKAKPSEGHGFTVSANALNPNLFDFQRDIVKWALAKGRAAIFADCGLGKTLLHKQIIKDSAMCRMGAPDYIITFRKPGDNPEPIAHPEGFTRFFGQEEPEGIRGIDRPTPDPELYDKKQKYNTEPIYSHQVWRRYANPVWADISQTNTLNYKAARDNKDERHICPLQLDTVARCIELWSNPDDIVLDPFAGIGTVPVMALRMGRRALGFELKESYYNQSIINLQEELNHDEN